MPPINAMCCRSLLIVFPPSAAIFRTSAFFMAAKPRGRGLRSGTVTSGGNLSLDALGFMLNARTVAEATGLVNLYFEESFGHSMMTLERKLEYQASRLPPFHPFFA
jgi:hypothetical protein